MSRSVAFLALLLLLLAPVFLAASVTTDPRTMPPHPRVWEKFLRGELDLPRFLADPAWARAKGIETPHTRPKGLTGTLNALAVAVKFSDNANTVTASFFDSLIFAAPVGGRGSVRDYFNEVSYGQVDIVTVNLPSSLGWRTAPQTYAYYVGYCGSNCGYCFDSPYPHNCQKLAEDIVDAVNSVVDFSQYDNDGDGYAEPIMLIHAGPGAEFTGDPHDIWSHSWSLMNPRTYDGVTIADYVIMPEYWMNVSAATSDMTIGVFAHEMGHGFWNLPDLYDRDYSSWGIGDWSLMAAGSWNGPNSGGWGTDGSSPAWPDAWSRVQMGFVAPTNITSNVTGKAIPQAYNNPAPAQTVLKMRSSALASQEYFLLENRQRVSGSYDEYLPGAGLLVWHVDEAMWNYSLQNDYECTLDPHCSCPDGYHYLVALEQADGARHLEFRTNQGDANDPFPGGTNNRNWTMVTHPESSSWYACTNSCIGVTNISDSGATMTADLQVSCGAPPSHWIYLPLVFRHLWTGGPSPTPVPTTPPGWQTLLYEDFEASFPGPWDVFDNVPDYGEYYWGKRNCRPFLGGYSGWAVGGGANGASLPCGSNYPDYAEGWMVYGPFSLVGAGDADLTFKLWLHSESGYDGVCRLASIDGLNYYGWCTSGDTNWIDRELDLTNVPTLGNLLGQPQVWVALVFTSDYSVHYTEGAYVDNVLLRKWVGLGAPDHPGIEPVSGLQETPAWLQAPATH
ncbi:MAG: M6 family metalloprotease domain-containing protein [Chloroflexia bacterium]